MRVLILNQPFHPDVVSTGQHAADLAKALVARGHHVTALCSSRAYDDPRKRFPAREKWNGVEVIRVAGTGFGKAKKWHRAADFATFMVRCAVSAVRLPKYDVVIAMTTPPLIACLGAALKRWKKARLLYWTMDLNPDEAFAAGWLKANSLTGRVLTLLQNYSLRKSDAIVVLDRFMKRRITEKGIVSEKIAVIAPWSHNDDVCFDREARNAFRAQHGLADKFVVMYSGNHSVCHPLDTLMQAARALRLRDDIVFLFIGGGTEYKRVQAFAAANQLKNIKCLPYQPREMLAGSLSAADLHVIVMGDPYVGIVHPCKIYNVLSVGAPFLYIGPEPSHVTDLLPTLQTTDDYAYVIRNGDVQGALNCIIHAQRQARRLPPQAAAFSSGALIPVMISAVESVAGDTRAKAAAASA